jgi:methionyl-tRNA formyltransferase
MPVRVIFMGTPEFAVPSFTALVGLYSVAGVFTQPDRETGRGRRVSEPPVKKAAADQGIPVFQPEKLSDPVTLARLTDLAPDLIVVAAYGRILQKNVLALPRYGCVNVHPSLLPRHRGASPVAGAILAGDTVTGVSIMVMDDGTDTGPILSQEQLPVSPDDTTASLTERLADSGAGLLVRTLPSYVEGRLKPQPQDDSKATYTRVTTKEDAHLDWSLPANDLWLRVRAYNPWPGAFALWNGKRLKVLEAVPVPNLRVHSGEVIELPPSAPARIGVGAGEDSVLGLRRVQLEGKKEASVEDFARGYRDFTGSMLG